MQPSPGDGHGASHAAVAGAPARLPQYACTDPDAAKSDSAQLPQRVHAQLVTLKAVKTAGPLMGHLEKKLQEVSEKLSKATVDVVTLQEKQMLARVELQTGIAELSLEKPADPG